MTEVDLTAILQAADEHVADELECMPEVVDAESDFDVDSLPVDEERLWHRVKEAAAVVFDLKGSTRLGLNQRAPSTASIYEATTGNAATILNQFDADFLAIQGDGGFGLFWGEKRRARAVCAAITIQTFGEKSLVPKLTKKWDSLAATGLKVGVAYSSLLVKRVGIPGEDSHEPVWAGRAVNYAAKCAQQADKGQMIVTGTMWDWVSANDYLAASCGCGGSAPSTSIWEDVTIDKIPEEGAGKGEREGKLLTAKWCDEHGDEYCNAVLSGKHTRQEVSNLVASALETEYKSVARLSARRFREQTAEQLGLSGAHVGQNRNLIAERARLPGSRW